MINAQGHFFTKEINKECEGEGIYQRMIVPRIMETQAQQGDAGAAHAAAGAVDARKEVERAANAREVEKEV